jgi:hypothetical protein
MRAGAASAERAQDAGSAHDGPAEAAGGGRGPPLLCKVRRLLRLQAPHVRQQLRLLLRGLAWPRASKALGDRLCTITVVSSLLLLQPSVAVPKGSMIWCFVA